jgi:hypothetical protein
MPLEEQVQTLARIENLLTEQLDLARDTNKVVHSIRRANWISFWIKFILWTFAIIVPLFFLGPFLKSLLPSTADTNSVNIFGIPSTMEVQKMIQTYRGNVSR